MRKIDRYVGIPLTFAATWLYRLWRLFLGRQAKIRPKKILFIELSEMGSTILADPAMRKARDHFDAELYFVIFRKNKASLTLLGTVPEERIFALNESSLTHLFFDVLRFIVWGHQRDIDTVVDLELFSRFSALLSWLSGTVNRVGFYRFHNEGLYRGELLTHKVAYNPHIHIAKNFLALVYALIAETPEVPYSKRMIQDNEIILPVVHVSEAARTAMLAMITRVLPSGDTNSHRLVLLNPNSSQLLPQRRWDASRYINLARMVLERYPDVAILITGAPDELPESLAIVEAVGDPRCANLSGLLRLEELPALYELAALMVTNDSGPGHFSSITSMPTIILFGPETPHLYGSLGNARFIYAGLACSPCVSAANHRKSACIDNVCLKAISTEMVFAQAQQILDHGTDSK
jgi:ADP-heptose:LPS heptosyltransferase